MSYKDYLKEKIEKLRTQIASNTGEVEDLQKELSRLEMQEFEEDMKESENTQVLLKG